MIFRELSICFSAWVLGFAVRGFFDAGRSDLGRGVDWANVVLQSALIVMYLCLPVAA